MATVSEVMAFAGKWVGYSRYEDPEQGTVFGRWYAKLTNSPWFGTTGVPYCMMFVTYCLYLGTFEQKAKCVGTPSAGCTGSMKLARSSGKLKHIEAGQFGDVVYFDWSQGGYWSGNADHVGFIRSVDTVNRVAYTREGNVSGCVKDCVRDFADIVGCVTPEYSKAIFTDVDDSTPHHEDIKWMKDEGIAKGYSDGSYRPSAPLTRADCATFLHRLAGTRIFTDVPDSSDIAWMAVKGISQGFPDGTFRPNDSVKRADMAAFLYRMAGCPEFEDTSSFTDVDDSTPHAEAIRWLGSEGISKGYADGTFKPMATLTRGDAAAFLHRLNDLLKKANRAA